MASTSSETIWSSMIAARQLSMTYYTLSTCLTDFLHRYFAISSSETTTISSSLFHNLDETLFSSVTSTNQSKLLDDYFNFLQNILKKNSIHSNIIQNVRRLFRFDSCLKQLFTTELNEYCQCQECDCTISNSITDVIHDVEQIRTNLLIESSQISCTCFRCGDQNQLKTLIFKQFSPCLALTVNHLNINANDKLTNSQGVIYELCYIIEFDKISRSIINVYLREDTEFIKVDGTDLSSRSSTINSQGKFLTLWLSRTTTTTATNSIPQPTESISHNDTFLSPPQSASSSSQLISNSVTTNNDLSIPYQTASTITFDEILIPPNVTTNDNVEDDDQFWNSLTEGSPPAVSENMSSTTNNDTVTDLFLTLLHSANKESSPIKSRTDHDRTVNTLATDVLWPLIVDQTNRRTSKKSSSSTTTTTQSISSNSSIRSSTNRSYKQLPSTMKSRRPHPYTTA